MVETVDKKVEKISTESNSQEQQFLTFIMGKDEYGVDILAVQEIHIWVEPRPMPNTPEYIRGVIDWRGTIVPIIDLRVRFKYPEATYTDTTVVIILQTKMAGSDQVCIVGIVVDAVADVYDVSNENLKKAPNFGSKIDTKYIKGMTKINESMIIILDIERLINLEELTE
ncbi:MAG: chemotaxis protein CheW [Gammaproteobacteria bacterium]|nr:MAG: chemotaxis protein CheW [Gammaproteobacteria bacterium]